MATDLTSARRQLMEALGESSQTYWNLMKLWYKQKIGKDDFDAQARQCLGTDNIHFHNTFLLAILAKCQALGATPASHPRTPHKPPHKPQLIKRGKVKKQRRTLKANFEQRFSPCDPLRDAPLMNLKVHITEDCEIGLCSYDLMLPDITTLHGRLFLGAWDAGLDNVADETVPLIQCATEHLVKDILTICCARRSPYRLRDGHFRYASGTACPKMHLRNSNLTWPPPTDKPYESSSSPSTSGGRTLVQAAADAALAVSLSDHCSQPSAPISLYDLRDSLQVHRRVVPSHTVYTANMERILSQLWHPSHDEIEQNQLHR
ncbi:predicted protein, partial [Nematostella vectensis]